MRLHQLKAILKAAVSGAAVLLLGVGSASAAQINITAAPTSAKLPDGSSVPMWGYSCDPSQPSGTTVTCSALNTKAGGAWSPIVITVPYGTDLSVQLTNGLLSAGDPIPTSLVIAGQLGGGLGTPVKKAGPTHDNQGTTWPIANAGPIFTPPAQGPRVQSFGQEVLPGTPGTLNWTGLKPGTYLLESGTHPSIQATMGLVGMVVVTTAPGNAAGVAYPNVNYNAELSLLFSEIDPAQNNAVSAAVNTTGFSETATHGVSTSGPIQNINVINGGSGYTSAPKVTITGGGAPTTPATAQAVIDTDTNSPTYGQVTEIDLTNAGGAGYSSTPSVSIAPPTGLNPVTATAVSVLASNTGSPCSGGAAACYPPVVNYSPLYYLINGVAFDRTNSTTSLFAAAPASAGNTLTGNVLVRMVNAGSRMHVPTIVGSSTTNNSATANGFTLIAEDGNRVPGAPRIQSEVFMAAGKTFDVMIDAPAAGATALPVFDRQLSLSGNSISRDAGMLAYISVNGNGVPSAASGSGAAAHAVDDLYNAVYAGKTLTISDPAQGLMANDTNIFGVKLQNPAGKGVATVNSNGTFSYVPDASWSSGTTSDSFSYCGNGVTSVATCATVTVNASTLVDSGITLCPGTNCTFQSNVATALTVKAPGILDGATEGANLALSVDPTKIAHVSTGLTVSLGKDGSFTASAGSPGTYTFDFTAQNTLGKTATSTVTINFPTGSGLKVTVLDGSDKKTVINGYRWIIEEDRTFFSDPNCTANPPTAGCPGAASTVVPNFGTNFHTSYMPVVATGCTDDESCGNSQTVLGSAITPRPLSKPSDVALCSSTITTACLDPKKRYYISVLPGDAAQPFIAGYAGAPDCSAAGVAAGSCGHGMGGAPIAKGTHDTSQSITVMTEPSPYPPATLTVFVFEDDYPLNGEHDAGGGVDILSPNEPGLGGFEITLQDNAGGTGDATGTPTYDMFNMPLSNSLAGTIDPTTGVDACPISGQDTQSTTQGDSSQKGIVGMIVTCPKFESDGKTLSPLAGQAVVKNLYQGRYGVVANPGADRIGRGEEWLQTNTLDGQKAHDSFMRIGEPAYFQEFGPAGYHVTIGFANPKIINQRGTDMCNNPPANFSDPSGVAYCGHEVKGHVTTARMSRVPDERLYGSNTHDSYSFTQCYISLGDPDGAEFMFTKCDPDGNFDFTGVPAGNWKITTFDQWNDQVVDGITTPVGMCDPQSSLSPNPPTNCAALVDLKEIAVHQWQANIYTRTFIDTDYSGLSTTDKPGLALVDTNIRFRDGSFSNFNNTDLDGYAGFNEVFPLFNWYVIETDSTRYKNTGTHVVYDSGGPVDNPSTGPAATDLNCSGGTSISKPCEKSDIAANLANTYEPNPLPSDLSVPGSVYCTLSVTADCTGESIAGGPKPSATTNMTTGRIDAAWVDSYGWQGYSGQNNFLEFGKRPFADGENGGIHGHVVYASTRPFDDPQLLLQTSWEPLVPHVRVNLYKEGVATDGVTQTLTLVDHTETSSFDDWAQGFRQDASGNLLKDASGNYIPNMNCPGQGTDTSTMPDPYFWFALKDQPQWLDILGNDGNVAHPIAHDAQYKCYDGMHNWNQLQPAPYDGMYSFPSVTARDPQSGKPTKTNCTACVANPTVATGNSTDPNYDPFRAGTPMLPDGKYVVEIVVPEGFELVKEEDKNILIGDNFIAPATQQFGGLASIFILPDQASVASAYNSNNAQNPTTDMGRTTLPSHEADTGNVETFWPCVGAEHQVPDYISLFPDSKEVSPFAGATRHLCDRKEVQLDKQASALAKFYIFTETHAASHFTGVITDDFTAEFDPFSPQFGEKFGPAYIPVSFKDWAGNEIDRVYTDAWGAYNGLSYSTWEVNPPNPTGYGPTMMVGCMNDSGPVLDTDPTSATFNQMITDKLFQSGYSQFCYELPFMPGQTGYFDTPVVPTSAFAGGYNAPDCAYPDATPAIAEVDGDGVGPWVQSAGNKLTIKALGDQSVDNYNYSGPGANVAPFNQQKVKRHYGFGITAGTVVLRDANNVDHALTNVSWSDTLITGNVPNNVGNCTVQQQAQYGGPANTASFAKCGELIITAANGKQSVDTVTVTIGGKAPTRISPTTPQTASGMGSLQQAIDAAKPGDLIILQPGIYSEMALMWKPVRLQGVGAAASLIDADPHPAGKLDPWRREVVCLFGLALNGQPYPTTEAGRPNPFDSTNTFTCPGNLQFFSGGPDYPTMAVDRIPMEGILGWDTTVNGNLAEQLIEPSLMGAYEGAGITVLAKGVKIPAHSTDVFGSGSEAAFPTGSTPLTAGDCSTGKSGANLYPSNFLCNPSSIDGLTVRNSSQGGGGILVHAWGHNLQIANNRVYNNQGTLSGGITVGQGEHTDVPLVGGGVATVPPGSCLTASGRAPTNLALPFCYDLDVNVHHNQVIQNSSLGDELFTSTPAGAGGVSICNGSDYYKFNYNWVCGNMSTGDGAGVAHIGFSYYGDIEHNTILFNQTTNPTIVTNGGGLLIMGAPDPDPPCATNDQDCISPANTITPSDGAGPGLTINANLILGNSADSGSGGGLRLQNINGTEVINFPNGNPTTGGRNPQPTAVNWPTLPNHPAVPTFQADIPWNAIQITNNIIANNVAGIDGGGVSLFDALATNIINNTIVSNNSTATSGVLLQTLFAPLSSSATSTQLGCTTNNGSYSCPQVAGLVSVTNSEVLTANMPNSITCPAGHGAGGTGTSGLTNGSCRTYSYPIMDNNVFWRNRDLMVGVSTTPTSNFTNQQNTVTIYNANFSAAASQNKTGACNDNGATYWDIGVRGDSAPGSGKLLPIYSLLTNSVEVPTGQNDEPVDPSLTATYCNGSRVPVEASVPGTPYAGWFAPPGTNESNALPAPPFTLLPAATVDEGNNWLNLRWGPLSMNQTTYTFDASPSSGTSPAVNYIPTTANGTLGAYTLAPTVDFFGNPRKTVANPKVDAGAIEFAGTVLAPTITGVSPSLGYRGQAVPVTITGTNLTGAAVTVSGTGVTAGAVTVAANGNSLTTTFTITSGAAENTRNVTVTTNGGAATLNNAFTVAGPTLASMNPTSGVRGTTVPVTLSGNGLAGATAVNMSGTGAGNVITCSGVTSTADGTTVTANCAIPATANLTTRTVSVTSPNGTSNTVNFTVQGYSLTSVTPAFGSRGTTVAVTLTGVSLTGATAVNISGSGVTVSGGFTVVNSTTITTHFAITNAAGTGNRIITVTSPLGTTNGVNFSVHSGTVAFSGPTPAMNGGGTGTKNATITVSNTATGATAGPVTLTAAPGIAKTSGTGNGTFSITGGTCVSGFVINAGSSCTVNVQYSGQTNTSTANAAVTITDTGTSTTSQTTTAFPAN